MKSLIKKLSKVVVTVVCASMIFQSMSINAMATEENNVTEETTQEQTTEETTQEQTTEETTQEQTTEETSQVQLYEEQLKGIGQNAVDRIADKSAGVASVDANISSVLEKANASYSKIASATVMEQALLVEVELFATYINDAQSIIAKAEKSLGNVEYILTSSVANFDTALAKAQNKEASVTGAEGKLLLAQADASVAGYKAELEKAQQKLEQIKELQQKAKDAFATKPVVAHFYVLNRGLEVPANIWGSQKDYSEGAIGELHSGVAIDGQSDYSYLVKYQKEDILTGLGTYFKTMPTRDQINAVLALQGDQLAENETIEWYGIKTIGGIIHVDGKIVQTAGGNEDPTDGNEAPADGNEDPAGGNETPAGGNEAPADGNEAPAGGNETPAGGNETPAGGNEAPAGGNEAPAGGNEAPVGGNETANNNDENVTDDNITVEQTDESITIEDEATALSGDITVIEDEETPLASGACRIHWLILFFVMVYTVVQIICIALRGKKIRNLEDEVENIVM